MEYIHREGVRPEGGEDDNNGGYDNDNRGEGGEEENDLEQYLKRIKDA